MKKECSVVRDLLPLYIEDMLSDDTIEFVESHLKNCPECAVELQTIKEREQIGKDEFSHRIEDFDAINSLRKKMRREKWRIVAIIAIVVLMIATFLYYFPIYRYFELAPMNYYSNDQITKAMYIGSKEDRSEAQSVLRMADEAFADIKHTDEENEKTYGLLARYATDRVGYDNAAYNEHSLKLWSAHLEESEGWIWVFYSSETFDKDGHTLSGRWDIPSLWKVEKDDNGIWKVVEIIEHP